MTNRFVFALSTIAFASSVHAAEQPTTPQVHNIAPSFVSFYDANKDKPLGEQVAAFKQTVAAGFPGFYSEKRYEASHRQLDKLVDAAIKDFPAIREDYVRKSKQFEAELPRYLASFKAQFPDYVPNKELYVVHSLGELDGGIRNVDGKHVLVFGVDMMSRVHGKDNEAAFFHHEMFHTYHEKAMAACDSDQTPIWASLWTEGLAVYVSKVLNPDANEAEIGLNFPQGMAEQTRKVMPAALAHLESVLDKTDDPIWYGLFSKRGDDTGLPTRRGYYLGYLVAGEVAKKHDLRDLAKMDCRDVRGLVVEAVHALNTQQRQASAQHAP